MGTDVKKYHTYQVGNLKDMEWDILRKGVKRKVFTGLGATVGYNCGELGHEVKPHKHPHEQIGIIVSGEGIFSIDGKDFPMKAGSFYVVPGNVEHYLTVTSQEPCYSLDIFAPARLEILPEDGKG